MACLCVNSRLVITSITHWLGEKFVQAPVSEVGGSVTCDYNSIPVLNVKVISEVPLEIQLTALKNDSRVYYSRKGWRHRRISPM